MLKNKSKIVVGFLIILLLISATTVFASNEVSEANENDIALISADNATDTTPIADGNTSTPEENSNYKKSDVYLFGDTVSVDYIVDGNLFICANKVYINSQIGGDAFIMAKEIVIDSKGYVFSNLFALSDSLDIRGVVYDLYSCANTIAISGGYVYRDARISCSTLNINGIVGRNAFVNSPSINFNTDSANNGIIYGNLDYSTKSEISIPDGVVSGTVTFTQENSSEKTTGTIISENLVSLGGFLAFVLLVWLVCSWLAPKFLDYTNNYVGKQSLKVFGIGLLTLVAIPVSCIILILLQLTASFSLCLLALYILTLVVANSIFVITANKYLCTKLKINGFAGTFGMLIVSGIILWVIINLPYVGGFINFIMTVLGLGILVSYLLPNHSSKKSSEKESELNVENKDKITSKNIKSDKKDELKEETKKEVDTSKESEKNEENNENK